jgi:hypothetical protein
MSAEIDFLGQNLRTLVNSFIKEALPAIAVLVIGWLVAYFASKAVATSIRKLALDKKLASCVTEDEMAQQEIKMEIWISKGVFYIIILIALVGFFNVLGLTSTAQPINALLENVLLFIPNLIYAAILVFAAWFTASVLRSVVKGSLNALNVDKRLSSEIDLKDEKVVPLSKAVSDGVYWLVFLIFIPFVLSALKLSSHLDPINGMFKNILGYLPNLFYASVILFAGWIFARIAQKVVTNLVVASDADKMGENAGLSKIIGKYSLSKFIGLIVYVMILVPVVITALETLKATALTGPLSEMLKNFLNVVLYVIGAGILLLLTYIVGRIISRIVSEMLTNAGFNSVLKKLGVAKGLPEGAITPSEAIGKLVLVAIMLLASMEACKLLNFNALEKLIFQFITFGGNVILGLLIFAIGIYLANLAYHIISDKSEHAGIVAMLARVSIMVFAAAMALDQMGLGREIINMAFAILFGAIAIAVSIAFGIGGRDFAARKIEDWSKKIEKK